MTHPSPTPAIGVFDSGVGGLTVLRALRQQLPQADLLYVADTAHAPYGERSSDYIADRSLAIAGHLIQRGAALLVVACNTATAHAVQALRSRWPEVPVVGIEPGIKPAVTATRNGRVGVLATRATLESARYQTLLSTHAQATQIFSQACPGLAALIEQADLHDPALLELIERYCAPLREAQVDTVLLGCTHYPLVQAAIQAALGPAVLLLNTEAAVAREAHRRWSHPGGTAQIALHCTAQSNTLSQLVRAAFGWELGAEHVDI